MAGKKNSTSAGSMHSKEREKLISGIEKKIIKSKDYRTSVKLADADAGKSAATAAAVAAVDAIAEMKKKKAAKKKKSNNAFEVYCSLVDSFAKARRKRAKARRKNVGKHDPKTGQIILNALKKAEKVKKAKKLKPYKAKKIKK